VCQCIINTRFPITAFRRSGSFTPVIIIFQIFVRTLIVVRRCVGGGSLRVCRSSRGTEIFLCRAADDIRQVVFSGPKCNTVGRQEQTSLQQRLQGRQKKFELFRYFRHTRWASTGTTRYIKPRRNCIKLEWKFWKIFKIKIFENFSKPKFWNFENENFFFKFAFSVRLKCFKEDFENWEQFLVPPRREKATELSKSSETMKTARSLCWNVSSFNLGEVILVEA
jgi:hypothetical protein